MTMKKNNEEIMERMLKAHELSDDKLEKVSGGFDFPSYSLKCTCTDCLINSNTYFSGGISGDENGMPCPVCNNGTWVVTKTK